MVYRNGSESEIALQQYPDGYNSGGYVASRSNTALPLRGGRSTSGLLHSKKFWIISGVVVAVVIAAVVGGVVGTQSSDDDDTGRANVRGNTNNAVEGVSMDSNGNPLYPSATSTAAGVSPTVASNADLSCGDDPFSGTGDSSTFTVRDDHPRLFAPSYRWDCLRTKLIANDRHLQGWNETIMANASRFADMGPVEYVYASLTLCELALTLCAVPTEVFLDLVFWTSQEKFNLE